MAAHIEIVRRRRRQRPHFRRPRVFRDRSNPLEELDEEQVFARYRFRPATILFIVGLLPELETPTRRNLAVPALLQVLLTLRFLATGAIHQLIGDSLALSRATTNRLIRRVTSLLASKAAEFVRFPGGEAALEVKSGFSQIAGFPNVLGCVDGTFIRIQRPKANEQDFVNRKGYHSLNVQMCCDHRFMIRSCYAAWPGSVHDSRVFRSSALCAQFENGDHNGLLLGDGGYPCRYFLMTPYLNPNTPSRTRYNDALCRTRVLIEQTFGILKRRFQVLHVEQRNGPEQAIKNTVVCVILHNIGIMRGDIIDNEFHYENHQDVEVPAGVADGNAMRDHLAQTYFT